jgi:nucleotide-binding universal stress UspA family protein
LPSGIGPLAIEANYWLGRLNHGETLWFRADGGALAGGEYPSMVFADRPILVVMTGAGPEDEDALVLARRLAGMQRAPIAVVAVLGGSRPGARMTERAARLQLEYARRSAAALLRDERDVEVLPVADSSPHREILALAHERNAQLLVTGSEARGVRGRVQLGRWAASTVVHDAPCAVAVAPTGFRLQRVRKPLVCGVAFDGAPESVSALQSAYALAHAAAGVLRVIEVEPTEAGCAPADALAKLGSEIPTELVVLEGDPTARLTEASEDLDLLVCASRGRRPLRRLALGRIPLALMRSAACPLLIVAPGVPIPSAERSIA